MFAYVVIGGFVLFFLVIMCMKSDKRIEAAARLFFALLLGGLSLAGVSAIVTGVLEYIEGHAGAEQLLVQLAAGTLFCGVGSTSLYLYFIRFPLLRMRMERRRARYPGQPWMWDQRWQKTPLVYRSRGSVYFVWFVLCGLAAGLASVVYANHATIADKLGGGDLVVVLFFTLLAAIVLPCVIFAVKLLRVRRAFGDSTLELNPFPAPIGGDLQAMIQTLIREVPDQPVVLELHCRVVDLRPRPGRRTTQTRRGRIVWSCSTQLRSDQLRGWNAGCVSAREHRHSSGCEGIGQLVTPRSR